MKKFLLLIFLISIIAASAQNTSIGDLSLYRNDYDSKETLQAELNLNIHTTNQLTQSNFILSKDNKIIPISLFLEKLSNEHYFVYFDIPDLNAGVYDFDAKDLRYINQEDGLLKQASIKKSFNILNNTLNSSSVSIDQGIILMNTKLNIINNLNPLNITIEAPSYTNISRKLLLNDKLSLNIKVLDEDYQIKILYDNKEYKIPVLNINKNLTNNSVVLNPGKDSIIFLNSSSGNDFPNLIILNKDAVIYNPLFVKNTWNFPIYNLTFSIVGDIKEILSLDKNNIDIIKPNEEIKQIVIINQNKNPSKNSYKGSIVLKLDKNTLSYLDLNVNFNEKINGNKNFTYVSNHTFVNKTKTQVNEPKSKNSFIKIFIIIVIIVTVIYFIFKRKIKKEESFEEHFYKFKKP